MSDVAHFSDDNFEAEVLQSDVPVLVDFWATWCAPCRAIAPMIEQLATEYAGRAKIGKVNIDESQGKAQEYGVMAIPTLILFNKGQLVGKVSVTKSEIKKALDALLE